MENNAVDNETLNSEMRNIIEEARVILPGVQALFGFQTIAVFNDRFTELPGYAKDCHLLGLGMVIIAVALVMTPAVYYRAVEPVNISKGMVRRSSSLIRWALAPLACGLALDMFTVIIMATKDLGVSIAGAGATFLLLTGLWFMFPQRQRRKQLKRNGHQAS
ncbi:MAG: DUF6328 family protein [Telluria sp.]